MTVAVARQSGRGERFEKPFPTRPLAVAAHEAVADGAELEQLLADGIRPQRLIGRR